MSRCQVGNVAPTRSIVSGPSALWNSKADGCSRDVTLRTHPPFAKSAKDGAPQTYLLIVIKGGPPAQHRTNIGAQAAHKCTGIDKGVRSYCAVRRIVYGVLPLDALSHCRVRRG
jgi:hypothetical protein